MNERAGTSRWTSEGGITQEVIREELSRILASPFFLQSDRLGRFLRYTVETTLAGKAEMLKEYRIGTEVYDRKPPYHPSSDSIVRSEARRLRQKLKQYYESNGNGGPVSIYYRPGSYVPRFRRGESQKALGSATERRIRELLIEPAIAKTIEISSLSGDLNLQIVFEGTIRVSFPGAEVAPPVAVDVSPERSKQIQFKKTFGRSATKPN